MKLRSFYELYALRPNLTSFLIAAQAGLTA